jgi:hypothetical protein
MVTCGLGRKELTMKKLILSLAAVAALAGGAAFAQSADCQAGSGWGTPPGCGNPSDNTIVYGNNSGWPPANGNVYSYGYAIPGVLGALGLPQVINNGGTYTTPDGRRVYVDPNTCIAYAQNARRSWDRDGDGIANNRDRYPDDPRYR